MGDRRGGRNADDEASPQGETVRREEGNTVIDGDHPRGTEAGETLCLSGGRERDQEAGNGGSRGFRPTRKQQSEVDCQEKQ